VNVVLFVGSPRARSNTRSILVGLRKRLEQAGASVTVLDPKRAEEAGEAFVDQSIEALRSADALVIGAPVYLDLPPFKALSWMQAVLSRRDELAANRLGFYAISHSGYFEPVHKMVSLQAHMHFCAHLGWTWRGGLAFGGTSPIDGRPLEETGLFGRRVRPALDALVPIIMAKQSIPCELIRRAGRSPIPLPRHLLVWAMNQMLRRS